MNSSDSGKLIQKANCLYNPSSILNKLVVKEILGTQITPTPPEVRLDHWRNKMRIKDEMDMKLTD